MGACSKSECFRKVYKYSLCESIRQNVQECKFIISIGMKAIMPIYSISGG